MKTVATALFVIAFQALTLAQETSVDPRLEENMGEKAITLQENNPDYYNFLVYDLDNAYFITTESLDHGVKQEVYSISIVKDENGDSFVESVLDNPETFNYKKYSFKRTHDNRVCYELSDGRYIIFYSMKEVKENYNK